MRSSTRHRKSGKTRKRKAKQYPTTISIADAESLAKWLALAGFIKPEDKDAKAHEIFEKGNAHEDVPLESPHGAIGAFYFVNDEQQPQPWKFGAQSPWYVVWEYDGHYPTNQEIRKQRVEVFGSEELPPHARDVPLRKLRDQCLAAEIDAEKANRYVSDIWEAARGARKALVFYEKHGQRFFEATTLESRYAAALFVAKERFELRYYHPGEEPQQPDFTKEQIASLPASLRQIATEQWDRWKKNRDWWTRIRQEYESIKAAIEADNGEIAYHFLMQRSRGEYERVELEYLEVVSDNLEEPSKQNDNE